MFELFNNLLRKNKEYKGKQKKMQSRYNKNIISNDSPEVQIIQFTAIVTSL